MLMLKQSTAVNISFGPAVLNSDGVTYVTNLTGTGSNQTENTTTGIRLSKNGGALAARHAAAGASNYDAFGMYIVPLDTTDTGTLGTLRMTYGNAAAFCPIFQDFMVLPANIWNSLFATGGSIPDAVAGASGGLLISGSNSGTTTLGALTVTGATTLTGAVALQSTLAVTGTTTLTGAVSLGSTLGITGTTTLAALTTTGTVTINALTVSGATTLTGAVSLGSTLGVTGTTTLAAVNVGAISGTTISTSGTVTLNALTVTNLFTINGTSDVSQTGDTYATITANRNEPGQGTPAMSTSILAKLDYLYKAWRNRTTQTATRYALMNDDAVTIDQKSAVSDDGTTFDRGEVATGP